MKKPTIMIVDDEKEFTDTFADFLSQRFNAKILVRKSAQEGIKELDKQRVDVLFQDMIMPGLGGEVVIDHIKTLDRINDMIIFIISKWERDTRTMKFEGYDIKHIPKPISLSTTQRILIEDFEIKGGYDYKKKRRSF
jgi:CheY-like chemotaxis protein